MEGTQDLNVGRNPEQHVSAAVSCCGRAFETGPARGYARPLAAWLGRHTQVLVLGLLAAGAISCATRVPRPTPASAAPRPQGDAAAVVSAATQEIPPGLRNDSWPTAASLPGVALDAASSAPGDVVVGAAAASSEARTENQK